MQIGVQASDRLPVVMVVMVVMRKVVGDLVGNDSSVLNIRSSHSSLYVHKQLSVHTQLAAAYVGP